MKTIRFKENDSALYYHRSSNITIDQTAQFRKIQLEEKAVSGSDRDDFDRNADDGASDLRFAYALMAE